MSWKGRDQLIRVGKYGNLMDASCQLCHWEAVIGKQRNELHGSENFNGEKFHFDDLRSAFSANYTDTAEL